MPVSVNSSRVACQRDELELVRAAPVELAAHGVHTPLLGVQAVKWARRRARGAARTVGTSSWHRGERDAQLLVRGRQGGRETKGARLHERMPARRVTAINGRLRQKRRVERMPTLGRPVRVHAHQHDTPVPRVRADPRHVEGPSGRAVESIPVGESS